MKVFEQGIGYYKALVEQMTNQFDKENQRINKEITRFNAIKDDEVENLKLNRAEDGHLNRNRYEVKKAWDTKRFLPVFGMAEIETDF